MFVGMGKHDERGWTKKDAEDAGCLLAGMVRRANKAVEAESSTQIEGAATISDHALPAAGNPAGVKPMRRSTPLTVATPDQTPNREEKAAEGSAEGDAHHPRQQLTVALGRTCDGLEFDAANDDLGHASSPIVTRG